MEGLNFTKFDMAVGYAAAAAESIKTSYSSAKVKMTGYAASAASNMISTIQKMEDKYIVIKQSANNAFAKIKELAGYLKNKMFSINLNSALSHLSSKVSNLFQKQVKVEEIELQEIKPKTNTETAELKEESQVEAEQKEETQVEAELKEEPQVEAEQPQEEPKVEAELKEESQVKAEQKEETQVEAEQEEYLEYDTDYSSDEDDGYDSDVETTKEQPAQRSWFSWFTGK